MCPGCKTKAKTKQQVSEDAPKPQVTDEVKQHAVDEAVRKVTGDKYCTPWTATDGPYHFSISDDVNARIQKKIDLFEE